MDHQHVFRQAWLSWKVLVPVAALFWQALQGGKWQVIWCLRRHHILHEVGSLCISRMWLFNFFLLERTLKQELQGKDTSCKGNFTIMPSFTTRLFCVPSSSLLFPSTFSSLLVSSFYSSSSSSCCSSFRMFGRPPGPLSFLQGPVGQVGCLRTGLAASSPKVPKYWNYSKVKNSDGYHNTVIFRCLSYWYISKKMTLKTIKEPKSATKKDNKDLLRTKLHFWY